jgi:predicted phage tail protein
MGKKVVTAIVAGALIATGVGAAIGASLLISAAVGATLGAISSLSKPPSFDGFGAGAQGRNVSSRSALASHKIIYGRTRTGGTIVHMEATESNKFLHIVIVIAGHEIDAFEKVFFDDSEVTLDGGGIGFSGKARVQYKLGTDDQTAFSSLVSESQAGWTSNHRLRGRAAAYVRLEYDVDKFPNGTPNISFLVRGKKVYDPRSETTTWSANPALVVADFLSNNRYGLSASFGNEIDSGKLISAANVCDENVNLSEGGTEKRYEAHGVLSTSNTPEQIINIILSAMSGSAVYVGGKWRIIAGAYKTPTLTFDENDLSGGIRVQSLVSRRENYNSIKGVFYSSVNNYVATDFPPIVSNTFIEQDNGEKVFTSIELLMTSSASMAQRLAKIALLRGRQQIIVSMPMKLTGLQMSVGDVVYINNTRMGWTQKAFEVISLQISLDVDLGVDVDLREISADVYDWATSEEQEFDPAPNTNLPDPFTIATPTNLVIQDTNVIAKDGTTQAGILITWDAGTNAFVNQYEVQWLRGASNFDYGLITDSTVVTIDNGSIVSTPTSFADYGSVADPTSNAETDYNSTFVTQPYHVISPAISGANYVIRVRAINTLGVRSGFVTATGATFGDTLPPNPPTGLLAFGGYREITISWINPTVADFDFVEVYKNTTNNFGTSNLIATIRGNTFVDTPLGISVQRFYWLIAVDRSGNKSTPTSAISATTEFIDSDSFSQEVMNLFAEAGAYGIEPVDTLPDVGDFDGQIKYDTSLNKLYRWDATDGVWTDDIFSITSGSVDEASFAAGLEPVKVVTTLPNPSGYTGAKILFLTTDNKLYRYTGTTWTTSVAAADVAGALADSNFPQNLRPVEVVSALPSTGNFQGRTALLTTDNKIYRWTGTVWTASVPTADLSGTISAAQIASVAAASVTGQLTNAQIQSVETAKLTGTITETQISNGAISTPKIAAGAISTDRLAAGAVTADTIAANAITAVKIQAGAVETAKIAAGAIDAGKIAASAITSDKIAANAVVAGKISADAVTTGTIAAGAINADKIAANAVIASKIAANAITADKIEANAVTSDKITANAITTGKIAAGAVNADQIAANAVTATKIQAGAIIADKIAAGAIQTDKIAANAITGGLIAASGVITSAAQINDAIITNAKIQNGAITTAKIGDAQITNAKIGNAQVNTLQIAGQAVTIPVSTYVSGQVSTKTSTTVASLTISSTGSPTVVTFSSNLRVTETGIGAQSRVSMELRRNGTTIYTWSAFAVEVAAADTIVFSDISPPAGTNEYSIVGTQNNIFIYTLAWNHRSMFALETKR